MRGKVVKIVWSRLKRGITPAYAGKRKFRHLVRPVFEDHPRVCGEKLYISRLQNSSMGSPPRMRGKVDVLSTFVVAGRITPAYAGKRFIFHSDYLAA